ncbi:hypothetical protein BZG36_00168 [Bifiguratus adelaidae]|uniref:Uncharacterized protein n=1 Tax=Bifiguratus adelaidae TaxID=1938954 RepID=A0A261Y864_9FUNG|nr:hypothetical protein BZG36_00168 [Bifiguratus adelaidae]
MASRSTRRGNITTPPFVGGSTSTPRCHGTRSGPTDGLSAEYIRDLKQCTPEELTALRERNNRLLDDSLFLAKLPDGGSKIRAKTQLITELLNESHPSTIQAGASADSNIPSTSPPLESLMDAMASIQVQTTTSKAEEDRQMQDSPDMPESQQRKTSLGGDSVYGAMKLGMMMSRRVASTEPTHIHSASSIDKPDDTHTKVRTLALNESMNLMTQHRREVEASNLKLAIEQLRISPRKKQSRPLNRAGSRQVFPSQFVASFHAFDSDSESDEEDYDSDEEEEETEDDTQPLSLSDTITSERVRSDEQQHIDEGFISQGDDVVG